jgi:hypothetical protein
MQRAVDHRRVNRAAHRLRRGRLYGRNHEHTTGFGLGQKGSQQFLFLLAGQVGMLPPALRLILQDGFPGAEILRMQPPHGLRLPAHNGGNLRSAEAERGPQPDRLYPLLFGFGFRLLQQGSEPLDGSLRKRLKRTHLTPPTLDPVYSCCSLMANWY